MKTHCLSPLLAGLIAACSVSAWARPLQRVDVPTDPVWVLHVDCDGLRSTALGQHILTEASKSETQFKLAAFQTIFNFDLLKGLHGLTLYSTGTAPQDGVLVVYADFDAARLVTLARSAKDYQSTSYKQHTIHHWIDEKKPAQNGVKPRTYAAICGDRVIFGQTEARVAEALNVMDKSAPALAASALFPELGAPGTTFIQAAARKLELPEGNPNAALMRLSQSIGMQMRESQGNLTTELALVAKDEEVAGHMTSIAQGLVSLMKLQTEKPESVKIAQATTLQQTAERLMIVVSMPVQQAIELLKAAEARKAAAKAASQ